MICTNHQDYLYLSVFPSRYGHQLGFVRRKHLKLLLLVFRVTTLVTSYGMWVVIGVGNYSFGKRFKKMQCGKWAESCISFCCVTNTLTSQWFIATDIPSHTLKSMGGLSFSWSGLHSLCLYAEGVLAVWIRFFSWRLKQSRRTIQITHTQEKVCVFFTFANILLAQASHMTFPKRNEVGDYVTFSRRPCCKGHMAEGMDV